MDDTSLEKIIHDVLMDDDTINFEESVGSDDIYEPSILGSRSPSSFSEDEEELNERNYRNLADNDVEGLHELHPDEYLHSIQPTNAISSKPINICWGPVRSSFVPRKVVSSPRECKTYESISANSKAIDIFILLFPKSLLKYIVQNTNERIQIARDELVNNRTSRVHKRSYMKLTDLGEIMIVLGCTMIMGYNKLPSFSDYWSNQPSLGNTVIKNNIGRDRCKFLLSKLYFAHPKKPANASKIYYIEDVLHCVKQTFRKYREDSHIQSIDESMTKFKGRSALKQYMPLKPTKRGVKMWLRSDAKTGYTYDVNIYIGKDTEGRQYENTLGERVVRNLASSIMNQNTTLCFDRFFTSVNLMNTLEFAAVGTCIASRKNMPKILPGTKFKRGTMEFVENGHGTIAVRWQDTKDVMLMSNCHGPDRTTVKRKQKDGSQIDIPAPKIVAFYREAMGGVDRHDRMVGEHEFERKSRKWWRKVFYRLLKMAIVNSWVIYKEKIKTKCSIKEFLVEFNEMAKRRRCVSCTKNKKDSRTYTMCKCCARYLCKKCFTPWHN